MREHLSDRELKRYRERELTPPEILALDEHLAACDACRVEIESWSESEETAAQIISALQVETDDEDDHLSYQQLTDHVDNCLSEVDRELCDSHLEFCAGCLEELNDLLAMKAKLAEPSDTRSTPHKPATFWQRLGAWWQLSAIRIPALVVTAAILVALLAWALIMYSRKRLEEAHIRGGKRENAATPMPGPTDPSGKSVPQQGQNNVHLVVELIDGDRKVSLDSGDKLLGLESAPLPLQNEVVAALKSERVKGPAAIASLKGEAGTLMGVAQPNYGLLSPVAMVVESRTPAFRWTAVEGIDSYEVTIYDADGKSVLTSGRLTKANWRASGPLGRGRTFSWQVRATKDGQETVMPPPGATRAKFRIIEQAKADELALIRQSEAGSHLLLGITYAKAGLLNESEREMRALVDANPKSSLARNLLRSVRALRH